MIEKKKMLKEIFIKTLNCTEDVESLDQKTCSNWDSMRHMFLIYACENEFNIQILPEDYPEMANSFHSFWLVLSKYL